MFKLKVENLVIAARSLSRTVRKPAATGP